MADNVLPVVFTKAGVDLKSTSLVEVVPIMAGKRMIVTRMSIEGTAVTGAATFPTAQAIGLINGDTAGVVAGPLLIDGAGSARPVTFVNPVKQSGAFWSADLSQAISYQAAAAGTCTSVTGTVRIEGFLY